MRPRGQNEPRRDERARARAETGSDLQRRVPLPLAWASDVDDDVVRAAYDLRSCRPDLLRCEWFCAAGRGEHADENRNRDDNTTRLANAPGSCHPAYYDRDVARAPLAVRHRRSGRQSSL